MNEGLAGAVVLGVLAGFLVRGLRGAVARRKQRGPEVAVGEAEKAVERPVAPLGPAVAAPQTKPPKPVVEIEGEEVRYPQLWGGVGRCDLRNLQTVSVVVSQGRMDPDRIFELREKESWALRVPVAAKGVAPLLERLTKLEGFSEASLETALTTETLGRYPLWRRALAVNAAIGARRRSGSYLEEFEQGWVRERDAAGEALSFVPWGITYAELEGLPRVSAPVDGSEDRRYTVEGAVYAGALALEGVACSPGYPRPNVPEARLDVPVHAWYTRAVLTGGGPENYRLVTAYLTALFGAPSSSYERKDQNSALWEVAGIQVRCTYLHNSDVTEESMSALLSFENGREYPQYLTDGYVESVWLEEVRAERLLEEAVSVGVSFRFSSLVRSTPAALCEMADGGWVVWQDEGRGKIGFASGKAAVIADRSAAVRLALQNIAPAKGGGDALILLVLANEVQLVVGRSRYQAFDGVLPQLEAVTGLPVTVLPQLVDV